MNIASTKIPWGAWGKKHWRASFVEGCDKRERSWGKLKSIEEGVASFRKLTNNEIGQKRKGYSTGATE